jgi:hypothetical protein
MRVAFTVTAVNVKAKSAVEKALKAQKGSRGTVLLFP